ncbi:hypothetical protein ACFFRR_010599 [Megaselia abdita]
MSNWFNRIQSDLGSVVTSCGHPGHIYPYRLEKVKFGVSLDEVCKNDIPAPLLILILKLNKESANRRDVFRAPGHQGAMKKLIHFLQAGRLVNIENYSVYTIASVLKKFLRKIPNGIFSRNGEDELFAIIELQSENEQQERIHKLFASLPKYTQQLLVLLFGTFRVIATSAKDAGTGMSSEALGVSVAPSFFHSCVSDGKAARMEDVLKFKTATRIMKHIIDNFGKYDLFGRENYEYYSRITGRIVKVNDEWICSFRFPPPPRGKSAQQKYAQKFYLASEKTWLQCESDRLGILAQEESRSTPALLTTSSSSAIDNCALSMGVTPEHSSFIESCTRLSVSLEGPGVYAIASSSSNTCNETGNGSNKCCTTKPKNSSNSSGGSSSATAKRRHNKHHSHKHANDDEDDENVGEKEEIYRNRGHRNSFTISTSAVVHPRQPIGIRHSSSCSSTRSSKSASAGGSSNHMTMDELRAVNRYAESTKSLSYLPQLATSV